MSLITHSTGKWILAGEHAVLRGAPALVFPLKTRGMTLEYSPGPATLLFQGQGAFGRDLELLFWGVVEKASQRLGRDREELRGHVHIRSDVPLGRGLGASAALCVVVGRWLSGMGWVREQQLYDFCRELENLFHGESSGVDIAVALESKPLYFERSGVRRSLSMAWQPHWALSYSGKIGMTSECVSQVKNLIAKNPDLGRELDEQMTKASNLAETALSDPEGFGLLAESIAMAGDCFQRWGLTSGALQDHLDLLARSGAVAVKPTGSGNGGYVLSLWRESVPVLSGIEMIQLN
jgi:mevalonate kinase